MTTHILFKRLPAIAASILIAAHSLAAEDAAAPRDGEPTHYVFQQIADTIDLKFHEVSTDALPVGLQLRPDLGLVTVPALNGQIVHRSLTNLYETRCEIMPNGDYLLMFPDGAHYNRKSTKMNDLVAYRSKDQGRTWEGPTVPIEIDYNLHGFIPFQPRSNPGRVYCFGTQPIWGLYKPTSETESENAPIGYRWSDDNGYTWSDVTLIRPTNDPDFKGMSVVRMCETESGVWLIGAHEADWSQKPLRTRQYILRSADHGQTWTVHPEARPGGWQAGEFGRMDETSLVSLGGDEVLGLSRTPTGYLWTTRSMDGGLTWQDPKPTPLEHPDAPAMVFMLSDKKTVMVLHHNRSSAKDLPMAERADLSGDHPAMADRAQVWVSLSRDGGRSWEAPRFLFANALKPFESRPFYNYQCSYIDVVIDHGIVHFFVPHRWKRAIHLSMAESELTNLPLEKDLLR